MPASPTLHPPLTLPLRVPGASQHHQRGPVPREYYDHSWALPVAAAPDVQRARARAKVLVGIAVARHRLALHRGSR